MNWVRRAIRPSLTPSWSRQSSTGCFSYQRGPIPAPRGQHPTLRTFRSRSEVRRDSGYTDGARQSDHRGPQDMRGPTIDAPGRPVPGVIATALDRALEKDNWKMRFGMAASILLAIGATVVASGAQAPKPTATDDDAAEGWTLPRTPWGDPDLQGVWTNETITPFERPEELQGREFLSDQEATEIEQSLAARRAAADGTSPPGSVGGYNQFWLDSGTEVLPSLQTSLVVDPPNGRVPTRPSAEATRDYNTTHSTDTYEYMSVWDRCITRGVPGSIFPAGYNNAYRILQTPKYVAILYEMIHDARIIPLDGSPHVNPKIQLWMGDSRGRWEGETLVVDVTNFTPKGWIASNAASRRIKGIPQTQALHVVERFARVDADTINYGVTIEDPEIYTRPWTIEMPLTRDPEYVMYEYACHEGNKAVELTLGGARALEKAAQGSPE